MIFANCDCIGGFVLIRECNGFAVERRVLFAAAEHLLGTSWLNLPPLMRLHWFLYGHTDVSLSINIKLFSLVQVNILSTQSVFVNININVWNFCVICLHDVLIILCGVPLIT